MSLQLNNSMKNIFVAGHRGMVGSAIVRQLEKQADIEIIVRTRSELNLTNQHAVNDFFDTNSIDAVYSAHNIEHLYSHEVLPTLKEFLRVLKPTGFTIITLPDLQRVAELIADDKLMDVAYQSGMGPISAIDMVFGHRGEIANGNKLMSHRTGFTRLSLTQVLKQAGFNEVRVMRGSHFDLWAIATVTHHDKDFWELMDKTIIVK